MSGSPPASPDRPLNILLVEDNPADVFLTEEAFEASGVCAQLSVARDGEEALRAVDTVLAGGGPLPDLLLLDLNLPRRDGFEVLAVMKSRPETAHIPVVVLTTSVARRDVQRSYAMHANSYVTKPVDLAEFIRFIRTLHDYWGRTVQLPGDLGR